MFRRWGSHATNIRGVFNGILPVQLVERYRNDEEASVWGLYAETAANAGLTGYSPAIVLGSLDDRVEIEILGWQAWYQFTAATSPGAFNMFAHLMTPILPYNPVGGGLFPSGAWVPGLITNEAFTRSTAFAITGFVQIFSFNPDNYGYVFSNSYKATYVRDAWNSLADQAGSFNLARPIRMTPGLAMVWQARNPFDTFSGPSARRMNLAVSILYRERTLRA
jgi:hypothetical protein